MILENKDNNIIEPALFYGIDFPYECKNHLIYNYNEIFPLKTGLFEGKSYPIPNNSEYYLINSYGDYMKFPMIIPIIENYSEFENK